MFNWKFGVLAVGLSATIAQAVPISVVSYDMPNGDGQAHGGNFNYWDKAYNGAGDTSVDRSPLSGGLGDLTDGVIATERWDMVENSAGTGPYVGWRSMEPVITFHFASPTDFNAVRIHMDDADGHGGVFTPSAASINGIVFPIADPSGPTPFYMDFDISSLAPTDSLEITVRQGRPNSNNTWIFLSEITFDGNRTPTPGAVPEPATTLLAGLSLLALASRATGRKA